LTEAVNRMTIRAHLGELERRDKVLEDEISEALAHSATDDLKIAELTRRKLQLKDEIERLRHDHTLWERGQHRETVEQQTATSEVLGTGRRAAGGTYCSTRRPSSSETCPADPCRAK
jgi:hypothetical protein